MSEDNKHYREDNVDHSLKEENENISESSDPKENKDYDETKDYSEYPIGDETTKKNMKETKVPSKKIKTVSLTSTLAVSAAIIIAGVLIINNNFQVKNPSINVNSLSFTRNKLNYDIDITNDDNVSLTMYLTSSSSSHSVDVTKEGNYTSYFEDLAYDTSYLLEIKGPVHNQEKTFYSNTINLSKKTLTTSFYSITWKCTCLVDNKARYTIDLDDDFHYWSSYKIHLVNQLNTSYIYDFDVDGEVNSNHVIDNVLDMHGGNYDLTLTCVSTNPADLKDNNSSTTITLASIVAGI